MEENSNIFLSGGDALVYLTECTKNIPQNFFGTIHLIRTYRMTNFTTAVPLYAPVHIFDDLPSIPPVADVLNRWPVSQLKNK